MLQHLTPCFQTFTALRASQPLKLHVCGTSAEQGCSRGATAPWQKLCPPLAPKWNYTLYRGLWRAAILSSSPPAPLNPLVAPSFLKVWLHPFFRTRWNLIKLADDSFRWNQLWFPFLSNKGNMINLAKSVPPPPSPLQILSSPPPGAFRLIGYIAPPRSTRNWRIFPKFWP